MRSWRVWAPFVCGGLILGLVARIDPPRRLAGIDRYVIPAGTAERVKAGESVEDVLPPRLATTLGRILVVVNHDTANHAFGPFLLAPGQQWSRRFGSPGDYRLDCSIYPDTGFLIAVGPAAAPAGRSTWAAWAALLAWCAASTVFFGRWNQVWRLASPAHGPTSAPPESSSPRRAERARIALREAAYGLPGLAFGVGAARLLALSRFVEWRFALSSPAALFGWLAVACACGLVLVCEAFLAEPAHDSRAMLLAVGGLGLVTGAVLGWPELGGNAVTVAIGTALLGGLAVGSPLRFLKARAA